MKSFWLKSFQAGMLIFAMASCQNPNLPLVPQNVVPSSASKKPTLEPISLTEVTPTEMAISDGATPEWQIQAEREFRDTDSPDGPTVMASETSACYSSGDPGSEGVIVTTPPGAWGSGCNGSRWISYSSDGRVGTQGQSWLVSRTVTASPGDKVILQFKADDAAQVRVNGSSVGGCGRICFPACVSVTLTGASLFDGDNTFSFLVQDTDGGYIALSYSLCVIAPDWTPTVTLTFTPTPPLTAEVTETPTATETSTPTETDTYTITHSPTETWTGTHSPTMTFTHTDTYTHTPTFTPTFPTPTFTCTPRAGCYTVCNVQFAGCIVVVARIPDPRVKAIVTLICGIRNAMCRRRCTRCLPSSASINEDDEATGVIAYASINEEQVIPTAHDWLSRSGVEDRHLVVLGEYISNHGRANDRAISMRAAELRDFIYENYEYFITSPQNGIETFLRIHNTTRASAHD